MTEFLPSSQRLTLVLEVRATAFAKWRSYSFWMLLRCGRSVGRTAARETHLLSSEFSVCFGCFLKDLLCVCVCTSVLVGLGGCCLSSSVVFAWFIFPL